MQKFSFIDVRRTIRTSWRVAFDKSEGVVKTENSRAVFFSPRFVQSWWRTEAL
jgi:hypothetical protein